jgi:UDP:flavonoid glycosyltransferase YjiC (YdhE family)
MHHQPSFDTAEIARLQRKEFHLRQKQEKEEERDIAYAELKRKEAAQPPPPAPVIPAHLLAPVEDVKQATMEQMEFAVSWLKGEVNLDNNRCKLEEMPFLLRQAHSCGLILVVKYTKR